MARLRHAKTTPISISERLVETAKSMHEKDNDNKKNVQEEKKHDILKTRKLCKKT